jgi:hypothetical protein
VLLRPVFLVLKPLVPRLRSYPEYTPLHRGDRGGGRGLGGWWVVAGEQERKSNDR